jgi:hypothetical protein
MQSGRTFHSLEVEQRQEHLTGIEMTNSTWDRGSGINVVK